MGIASFCPYNIDPSKCFPSMSLSASMLVTAKAHVLKSGVGSSMEVGIADRPKVKKMVATDRFLTVVRKVRWRAGG